MKIKYENEDEYTIEMNGKQVKPRLMFAIYELTNVDDPDSSAQYIKNNYPNKWQLLGMLTTVTEKVKQELTNLHKSKD